MQKLGFAFAQIQADQPEVAADAVLFVHHRVADLDLGQVAQHVFHGRLARSVAAPGLAHLGGIQLAFGDESQ